MRFSSLVSIKTKTVTVKFLVREIRNKSIETRAMIDCRKSVKKVTKTTSLLGLYLLRALMRSQAAAQGEMGL